MSLESVTELFNQAYTWLTNFFNTGKGDFYGAILFAVLCFFFYYFVRLPFLNFLRYINVLKDKKFNIPKSLKSYKTSLDTETLKLKHSWKLEGQSLKELIVPVNISQKGQSERLSLIDFIKREYYQNRASRFILMGGAGSGKSVAMGVITRKIWYSDASNLLVPVLMTFSDIKEVKSDKELEIKIVKTLERFQFEKGRRNDKAEKFVAQNLYEGNIILLFDGFDELEKGVRINIANFLNSFFQTHQNIPFIISSRTTVWNQNPNILPSLSLEVIRMAEFTPYEVRIFVSQWNFIGNKSAEHLASLINNKAYLKSVAVNPLMLTIITFLYSQPKRILPDNRVKFYAECVDALMEKWDNARNLNRANEFESIDKITILSELAYQHITNAKSTDEDITKKDVLAIITKTMHTLSRPIKKREKMLSEITQNAELLVPMPPDAFKFPHRTFMEYFAANYFFENNNYEELLELYKNDNGKWEETLSLFCGLNTNSTISDTILTELKNQVNITKDKNKTEIFVFKALVESARINPKIAEEILLLSEKILEQEIHPEIIENLGFISMNDNWQHSNKAKGILLNLLSNEDLSDKEFQKVIIALMSIKDTEIEEVLLKRAESLDLTEVLTQIGQEAEDYALKLLQKIPSNRHLEIFEGLAQAGRIEFLFNLLVQSTNNSVKETVAWALCLISDSDSFLKLLDQLSLENLTPNLQKEVTKKLEFWKWNKPIPKTKEGQEAAILINEFASNYLISQEFPNSLYDNQNLIHNSFRFIISAFLAEKGFSFNTHNIISFNRKWNYIDKFSLKKYWNNKYWNKIYADSDMEIQSLIFSLSFFSWFFLVSSWWEALLWFFIPGITINLLATFFLVRKNIIYSKLPTGKEGLFDNTIPIINFFANIGIFLHYDLQGNYFTISLMLVSISLLSLIGAFHSNKFTFYFYRDLEIISFINTSNSIENNKDLSI